MFLNISKIPKTIKYLLISFFSAFILVLFINVAPTFAAYDGGNLIDDSVFRDSNTMTMSEIQDFLVSKGSGLSSMSFALNCYGADSKERQWYTAVGAPCDQSVPASNIIYYASKIYGINPRVVLVTLQKEQSLITSPNPTSWQINQAMGYACPTSGQCAGNSNFFYQIDSGAWVLRYHYERARGNMDWWNPSSTWTCGTEKKYYKPNLYPNQNVNFYDENDVLYRTHFIKNAATSSMYCYTPHAYNNPEGLYGREPFGTTGMYYSGSYNFVYWFEQWFGSTVVSYNIIPIVYDGNTDASGETATIGFRLTSKPDRNVTFNVYWSSSNFSSAEKSIKITPSNWNKPQNNLMILKGKNNPYLKGNETLYITTDSLRSDDSRFNTGSIHTPDVPVLHQDLNKEVYRLYNETDRYHIFTGSRTERDELISEGYRDEGVGFYSCEAGNVLYARLVKDNDYRIVQYNSATYTSLINDSFEFQRLIASGSFGGKNIINFKYNSARGVSLYTTNASEGDAAGYSLEATLPTCAKDTTPIFRLYSAEKKNHFYTSSTSERNNARANAGYRYEGVGFYITDSGDIPVYRLYATSSKNHFYTTFESEKDNAIENGYRYEGIGFYINSLDSKTVHRLYSTTSKNHFYTTSESEKNTANSAGYRIEGTAFGSY